jgi:glycosyltransferase involved in cell wall biosynthesis
MISNSQRALDSLLQRGFSPRRSVVIPNGVVVPTAAQVAKWRAEIRSELGIPLDAPVAIYVGNLRAAKDPDCLLQAIRTAIEHQPTLSVLFVGREPTDAAAHAVFQAIGALPSVRPMGAIEDVMPLISASDVLVLSSRSEGCPTVVLEALACNCPVVSTDVGDVREIIGSSGEVVEVGNGTALGIALVHAIGQRGLPRKHDFRSPRDQVLGRHESAHTLARLVAEYRMLLESPG